MNRRMESVKLMAVLQPFTQLGCLTASDVRDIVEDFKNGDTNKLRKFLNDPAMPKNLTPVIDRAKQYC